MFEDFFSSARGPGVVGMVLAVVVLASFVFFGTMVLDGRFGGEGVSLDVKIEEQADHVAYLEKKIETFEKRISASREASDIRAEVEVMEQRLAPLTDEVAKQEIQLADVREGIAEVQEAHRTYRDNYRDVVRAQAVGTRIEELRTESGKVYKGVVIKAVDSLGLSFTTDSGPKKVPYTDLPAELQDLYQFGEEEAEAQRAKLREAEAEVAARVAASRRQQKTRRDDNKETHDAGERQRLKDKIAELERGITAAERKIQAEHATAAKYRSLHAQAMARGNVSSHLAKVQKAEQAAQRWQNAITAAEKQIAELERMLR